MSEIVNNFSLADLCLKCNLRQPEFTYGACGPFPKKQRKNTKV